MLSISSNFLNSLTFLYIFLVLNIKVNCSQFQKIRRFHTRNTNTKMSASTTLIKLLEIPFPAKATLRKDGDFESWKEQEYCRLLNQVLISQSLNTGIMDLLYNSLYRDTLHLCYKHNSRISNTGDCATDGTDGE